jgi:polysaccharide pyruvyl transferase WcaK-like protein
VSRQLGRELDGLAAHGTGLAEWIRTYWAIFAVVGVLVLAVVLLIVITIMSGTSVS